MSTISPREQREIVRANQSGAEPVVFVHGLWLLASSWDLLGNPANYGRAVALTFEQFRYGWANGLSEEEARKLYETYSVAGPGVPLFQAATANINPWTEAKVDTTNPDRGPLLIISGEKDHTVPWAIAHASYKRQRRNPGVTEIRKIPNRGHSLTIDAGWREVAEVALAFVKQHQPALAPVARTDRAVARGDAEHAHEPRP